MQLGFVSALLPDHSLEDVFQIAADQKYDCVEVMCWPVGAADRRYAGVTHIDVARLDEARIAQIRDLVERTGVQISGLGYYPNPLSPDSDEARTAVDHLHKVIDAAPRLGLNIVNTFIGRDPSRSVTDNWPRFVETWPAIVEHAERAGVRLGIENCPMYFTEDEWPGGKNLATCPAFWRRMFDAIPSPNLGLNIDPSHLVWQQIDAVRAVREFGSRIIHCHAKDAYVDRDRLNEVGILATPLEYHTPKLPGRGDLDWAAFLDALREIGYDGAVCVEVEDREYEESLERRIEALRESAEFLRPLLDGMIHHRGTETRRGG